MFDADISDGAKLLYGYLLAMNDLSMQNGKEYTYASAETMAKKQKVTKRTTKSRLYELEKAGFIQIERRKGKTSKVFLTSAKFFTGSSEKNCTTSSAESCTASSAENYTQYKKRDIDRVDIKRTQKRIDGNHVASYDSDAYMWKARNEPIVYVKKEDQADGDDYPELPF